MKITDEMVEAAVIAHGKCTGTDEDMRRALEAALAVADLPSESSPAFKRRIGRLLGIGEAALAAAPEPAWVEELAAGWERAASERPESGDAAVDAVTGMAAAMLQRCAAELRARAKGGER